MRFTASVIGPGSASKWKFHAPFLFYQQQPPRAERKIMIDDSSLFELGGHWRSEGKKCQFGWLSACRFLRHSARNGAAFS
jgi:hypothetical protein